VSNKDSKNIYPEDFGLTYKGIYENKETKGKYFIIDVGYDCTHEQIMVIYRSYEVCGPVYLREINDFKQKFTYEGKKL
jgi:hypothetical protein